MQRIKRAPSNAPRIYKVQSNDQCLQQMIELNKADQVPPSCPGRQREPANDKGCFGRFWGRAVFRLAQVPESFPESRSASILRFEGSGIGQKRMQDVAEKRMFS